MNKRLDETPAFVSQLGALLKDLPASFGEFEVLIAPSAVHLAGLAKLLSGTRIKLGAQNCGGACFGAFTGESSPVVLKEVGCDSVIVGHSERRHVFKEDDALVLARAKAALDEGLNVILCVGELLSERKAGRTFEVLERQLSILTHADFPKNSWGRLVVAYEPVWAIGTGENATPDQAGEAHAFIRKWFGEKTSAAEASKLRILYGGSVKPENSTQLMAQKDVDGFLVGGASLDAAVFAGVIKGGLISRT